MTDETLERAILAAHEAHDLEALARLYAKAGGQMEENDAIDKACFFYTISYVFALDGGLEDVARFAHGKLVHYGREE